MMNGYAVFLIVPRETDHCFSGKLTIMEVGMFPLSELSGAG